MARWQFDGKRWLDGEDSNGRRNGILTAMGSGRQWMARRQLDSNGWIDGNGWRCMAMVVSLTMMDGVAQRQLMVHKLLDGEGRRDSNSTAMDDEERRESDGN